ncbi:signal transduction histidine kinase [Evansella vedderi]|uniref:Signal transduction histidine-protein kinase ArlS n=1 Tax=Evansella vedderi TaxID=38282 RepID=A0ABT9ZWU6_9BACI|nr:HAMP domain-containing histidine kinase [Evansella vedderi]MDQ0255704.1 signal transduction histidine kinase [Evansella vedderi]
MRIRTKIQVFSLTLLLVIILILNTAVFYGFSNLLIDNELDQLERQTENIASIIHTAAVSGPTPPSARMLRNYSPSNGMIRIINEHGETNIVVTQRPELVNLPIEYLTGQLTTMFERENGEKVAVSYFPLIWEDGSIVTLEVTESLQPMQEVLQLLRIVLWIVSVFILIPALIGGTLLSKLILKPIQLMVNTMQEIQQKGTLKKIDLENESKDELYEMATTFNNMSDLLKETMDKKQQFVSDASHELKTPLTVIESNANMLKRWGSKDPKVLEESIDAILSESKRMREMTGQMLALAQDHTALTTNYCKIDLASMCEEVCLTMGKTYNRKINVTIKNPNTFIIGEEKKLEQVLRILIDNAIKYSSSEIFVIVGTKINKAYVSVEDQGIGIPKDKLDKVFDRFYRVDSVRSRETGGTGLGLAIADTIVKSHSGTMEVQSEVGMGTVFTVSLPYIKDD